MNDDRIFRLSETPRPVCVALLDSGEKVKYILCDEKKHRYPGREYLGEGVIFSVNGVKQNDTKKMHFYR